MDLKLTEEEKLIKETAAQFVDKELIAREGAFLKTDRAILAARRAGAARARCGDVARVDQEGARHWPVDLELPEALGGPAMSMVARVLIHREFGRSVLPFAPVAIPAFMFETKYGQAARCWRADAVVGLRRSA